MKIPRKIRILGHEWDVTLCHPKDIEDVASADLYFQNIKIRHDPDPKYHESKMAEGLLHEIIEIILKDLTIDVPHSHISALGAILFQVIVDNDLDFRKE